MVDERNDAILSTNVTILKPNSRMTILSMFIGMTTLLGSHAESYRSHDTFPQYPLAQRWVISDA